MFSKIKKFVGPSDDSKAEIFPVGLSRLSCDDVIAISFISQAGEITSMFSLSPGRLHYINFPAHHAVVVECGKDVNWSVRWPSRFQKSDPTRIEASLIRPRTQREEMQDYFNEQAARALGGDIAMKLRSGRAEFDTSQDDFSEEHEDDNDSPFSIHQMDLIMRQLQSDLAARKAALHPKDPPKPTLDQPTDDDLTPKPRGKVKPKEAEPGE